MLTININDKVSGKFQVFLLWKFKLFEKSATSFLDEYSSYPLYATGPTSAAPQPDKKSVFGGSFQSGGFLGDPDFTSPPPGHSASSPDSLKSPAAPSGGGVSSGTGAGENVSSLPKGVVAGASSSPSGAESSQPTQCLMISNLFDPTL